LPGLLPWLDAFWELSTERHIGMGPGPIPNSAIGHWAQKLVIDEPSMFLACIRAMDKVYLDHAGAPKDEDTVSSHTMSPDLFDKLF
jgi:hypothetical protein